MHAMLQQLLQDLLPTLGTLALAALTWALAKGAQYLQEHTHNAWILGVYGRLDTAALAAVSALEQTVVRQAQAGGINGPALKAVAIALVKSYMGPGGLNQLEQIVGADQLLQTLSAAIEAKVLTVSQQSAVAAAQSAPTAVPVAKA